MTCLHCCQHRSVKARGLCGGCYERARTQGVLDLVAAPPRRGRPPAHPNLLEDVTWLVQHGGYSWARPAHLAERLGMTDAAFRKALWRARRRAQTAETPAA
jgi:hypothetical protein